MNRERALAIASYLGMPWRHAIKADLIMCPHPFNQGTKAYPCSWTGKFLLVSPRRAGKDLLHEIGHWLTVSKKMRRLPEYGLGQAPWYDIHACETCGVKLMPGYGLGERPFEQAACWTELAIREACGGAWRERALDLAFDPPRRCSFRKWMESERKGVDGDLVPHREKCVSVAFTQELAAIKP
jgi:hypothetical protein